MESFLTVKDIAAALKVSEVFIYKLVRENQIPFRRIGAKSVRFSEPEIEKWLETRRGRDWHRDKF